MAATVIPSVEPLAFAAGDTVTWQISLGDYPASTWTLKYQLVSSAGKISITSAAEGDDHLVTLACTATDDYVAGEYTWQSYVENGGSTERYAIGTGTIEVKPNYAAVAGGYDGRSWTRATLDAIRARLRGDASTAQLSRRVGDLSVGEIPMLDLLKIEAELSARVLKEVNDEQLARGVRTSPNKIKTRFV